MNSELVRRLQEIGLNRLESEVYLLLCKNSPLTGYRIAQQLCEGSSNIYKALDALVKAGAVMVEDLPGTRSFTALPPTEYLTRQKKNYLDTLGYLEQHLPDNSETHREERVYRLETIEQVYERAEQMIRNAEVQIVADVFPAPFERLAPLFIEQAAKGVYVTINGYSNTELPGCTVVKKDSAERVLSMWNEDWINLVVDAEKYLLAVISKDGKQVRHAIWSTSPYLSYVLYSGLASEMLFAEILALMKKNNLTHEIPALQEKFAGLLIEEPPGYRKITGKLPKNTVTTPSGK